MYKLDCRINNSMVEVWHPNTLTFQPVLGSQAREKASLGA